MDAMDTNKTRAGYRVDIKVRKLLRNRRYGMVELEQRCFPSELHFFIHTHTHTEIDRDTVEERRRGQSEVRRSQ